MNLDSDLIEDVPVPDDGFRRAIASGNRTLHGRRALLIATGTALTVALFVGVFAVKKGPDENLSTAGSTLPGTTSLTQRDAPLLSLPAAALAATPAVPAGWQTIYYGLGQISVPGDWQPLRSPTGSERCGAIPATVVILGGGTVGDAMNNGSGSCSQRGNYLRMKSTNTRCDSCTTTTVNGLAVATHDQAPCVDCPDTYLIPELQLEIDMTIEGPEYRQRILDTLTPSPQARVLADGPIPDRTDWRAITDGSVSLSVPAHWPTRQLGATDSVPGACGGNPFTGTANSAIVGQGGGLPSCPFRDRPAAPTPLDGAWLRTYPEQAATAGADEEVITNGGQSVHLANPEAPDYVTVSFTSGTGSASVIVGIGPDPTLARGIVRSINVSDQPLHGSASPPTTAHSMPSPGTVAPTAGAPRWSGTTCVDASQPSPYFPWADIPSGIEFVSATMTCGVLDNEMIRDEWSSPSTSPLQRPAQRIVITREEQTAETTPPTTVAADRQFQINGKTVSLWSGDPNSTAPQPTIDLHWQQDDNGDGEVLTQGLKLADALAIVQSVDNGIAANGPHLAIAPLSRQAALDKARKISSTISGIGNPSAKHATFGDLMRAGASPPAPSETPSTTTVWVITAPVQGLPAGGYGQEGDKWAALVINSDTGQLLAVLTGGAQDGSTIAPWFATLVDDQP